MEWMLCWYLGLVYFVGFYGGLNYLGLLYVGLVSFGGFNSLVKVGSRYCLISIFGLDSDHFSDSILVFMTIINI